MGTEVRRRSALGLVALAASLGGAARARAQTARVDLTYARGEGAGGCPDARAFAEAVAGRLGYEPFQVGATRRVNVAMDRRERRFEARIELVEAGHGPSAERRFTSRATDCGELAATTELALAIAIDPFRATTPPERPAEVAPSLQPPPGSVAQSATPAVLAPMPAPVTVGRESLPPPRRVVQVAASVVGGFGSAPAPALGFELRIDVRRGDVSLGLEGRADLPATTSLSSGEVNASLLTASLVPCAHWRSFAACALVTVGVLRAVGNGLLDARQATDPWVALGARLAANQPLYRAVSLTAHADAVAPLVQTELKVSGAPVWTTPAIVFSAGIGLAVAFP